MRRTYGANSAKAKFKNLSRLSRCTPSCIWTPSLLQLWPCALQSQHPCCTSSSPWRPCRHGSASPHPKHNRRPVPCATSFASAGPGSNGPAAPGRPPLRALSLAPPTLLQVGPHAGGRWRLMCGQGSDPHGARPARQPLRVRGQARPPSDRASGPFPTNLKRAGPRSLPAPAPVAPRPATPGEVRGATRGLLWQAVPPPRRILSWLRCRCMRPRSPCGHPHERHA